jgi:hypothetical protein
MACFGVVPVPVGTYLKKNQPLLTRRKDGGMRVMKKNMR